jgi:hypothetical protein
MMFKGTAFHRSNMSDGVFEHSLVADGDRTLAALGGDHGIVLDGHLEKTDMIALRAGLTGDRGEEGIRNAEGVADFTVRAVEARLTGWDEISVGTNAANGLPREAYAGLSTIESEFRLPVAYGVHISVTCWRADYRPAPMYLHRRQSLPNERE